MGRWEPDARGRLRAAAIELFSERGFDQTTVADIAERAGVTERTFFRHFADKREVLFEGSQVLQATVIEAIASAEPGTPPIETVAAAMQAGAGLLQGNRDYSRLRATAIAANPSLHERELLKLGRLAAAAAEALRDRGVAEPAASLAAQTGVTLFSVGFEKWLTDGAVDDFALHIRESLAELKALTGDA
ncbi:TetR/AcrR family transcriptional regulator [Leifsonia poae]|uniref:TetR family transcriptional regulator n=1 Tax=Leifsonia poae TaxID=110933 RepID=A0A9W6M0L5_9MICO|nr:TetR family transcriptional regulator [Leifsonia poae]GLJ76862.1 TetR family transcriptional regulator [Leifsonia poae]